jgi:hypothetical protein
MLTSWRGKQTKRTDPNLGGSTRARVMESRNPADSNQGRKFSPFAAGTAPSLPIIGCCVVTNRNPHKEIWNDVGRLVVGVVKNAKWTTRKQ